MNPKDSKNDQPLNRKDGNVGRNEPEPSSFLGERDEDGFQAIFDKANFPFGSSSVGLIITEPDGTIISFNKTVQDLFGICIDDYRSRNVSDLYADPKDRKHLMEMLSASKTVRDFEVRIKHGNGTFRDVLANIDYVDLNDRHVLLTSIYDITQYKQRSQETDSGYQTLFKSVPVGITVTDFHGKIFVSNNAIKELLGYSVNDLDDMSIREFYYAPADRRQLIDLTQKFGSVRDFETKFRHKNGSLVTVLINTDIIEFNDQKDMLLTSIRDISNLTQVKDDLIRERDFSNAILNIAATLIVVLDHKGVITRFNRSAERISGYTTEQVTGTYLWENNFFDPIITREQIDKLLSDAHPKVYETVVVSRSGERRFVSWTFAAMRNKEGHIEYIISTGIDVTERHQAEEELQKANDKLAAWVEDLQARTEEMNQINELGEQLQSCQTIAEACAISARYIKRICPDSKGALYMINSSRDLAEAVEMWGEPEAMQKVFTPMNCWAIRRGRQHLVDEQHPGLLCGHTTGPECGQYLCVPLAVNGEAIGILHLNNTECRQENKRAYYTEHKTQLVTMIAEHIALAVSNLTLKETLRQQSIRDALTGLFNRRYMEETLERELKRAQREDKPIALVMFDIDHFKAFNDQAGHDAGDTLLRELGVYLQKDTRGGDIVCRYGGEEFLAVLPGANAEEARQRAEQMRRDVSELLVYHLGKALPKCTISLGVSAYPQHGQASETLLKAADSALYRAKNEGRNMVMVANTAC